MIDRPDSRSAFRLFSLIFLFLTFSVKHYYDKEAILSGIASSNSSDTLQVSQTAVLSRTFFYYKTPSCEGDFRVCFIGPWYLSSPFPSVLSLSPPSTSFLDFGFLEFGSLWWGFDIFLKSFLGSLFRGSRFVNFLLCLYFFLTSFGFFPEKFLLGVYFFCVLFFPFLCVAT